MRAPTPSLFRLLLPAERRQLLLPTLPQLGVLGPGWRLRVPDACSSSGLPTPSVCPASVCWGCRVGGPRPALRVPRLTGAIRRDLGWQWSGTQQRGHFATPGIPVTTVHARLRAPASPALQTLTSTVKCIFLTVLIPEDFVEGGPSSCSSVGP